MRYRFIDCELDIDRHELRRADMLIDLEPQVFELLKVLIANRQRVVTKEELLAVVWKGRIVSDAAMTTRMNAARCAVGDTGREQRVIKTIRGKGFRFIADTRQMEVGRPSSRSVSLVESQRVAIGIVPFRCLGRVAAAQGIADCMSEHLALLLSKQTWLSVRTIEQEGATPTLAHNVRYVLGGSVQVAVGHVRLIVRLIDAKTGAYLWADRFEGALANGMRTHDRLAEKIVNVISPTLERLEISHARREPDDAVDARSLCLRGLERLYNWTRVGITDAIVLFQRAIEVNPEFAPAYGMAAYCYVQKQSYGWFSDRTADIQEATRLAQCAMQFGQDDPLVLAKAAHAITMLACDGDRGATLIQQALRHGRNLPAAWYVSGWVQLHLGRPASALAQLSRAARLSPFDPLTFKVYAAIAYAHLLEGRYDEGSTFAERALGIRPHYQTALRAAAASHALAGRIERAQTFMTHMRGHDPSLRLSCLREVLPLRRRDDFEKYAEGLLRAGLPE